MRSPSRESPRSRSLAQWPTRVRAVGIGVATGATPRRRPADVGAAANGEPRLMAWLAFDVLTAAAAPCSSGVMVARRRRRRAPGAGGGARRVMSRVGACNDFVGRSRNLRRVGQHSACRTCRDQRNRNRRAWPGTRSASAVRRVLDRGVCSCRPHTRSGWPGPRWSAALTNLAAARMRLAERPVSLHCWGGWTHFAGRRPTFATCTALTNAMLSMGARAFRIAGTRSAGRVVAS
jgi:hypothetical protein